MLPVRYEMTSLTKKPTRIDMTYECPFKPFTENPTKDSLIYHQVIQRYGPTNSGGSGKGQNMWKFWKNIHIWLASIDLQWMIFLLWSFKLTAFYENKVEFVKSWITFNTQWHITWCFEVIDFSIIAILKHNQYKMTTLSALWITVKLESDSQTTHCIIFTPTANSMGGGEAVPHFNIIYDVFELTMQPLSLSMALDPLDMITEGTLLDSDIWWSSL